MITLQQVKNPSEHVQNRAKAMWCRARMGGLEWIVIPKSKHKARRLVRFQRRAGTFVIECVAYHNGKPCEANEYGRLCSHVERCLRQIEINEKRRQKKERSA